MTFKRLETMNVVTWSNISKV